MKQQRKNHIEADDSWQGHVERQRHRSLKQNNNSDPKLPQDHTQHGIMIDAGSQGTRLHLYEFEPRVLRHKLQVERLVQGQILSFPTTDTRWTHRLKPGLDYFAFVANLEDMRREVRNYLEPLLQFAKETLQEKQEHWQEYPIYLKATGGLRTLPAEYRLQLIDIVRELFRDSTFNPFFFETEHARVISGEEEAIYGWTAVNFAQGVLLPQSTGSGEAVSPNKTYGMLEMGGASAQIAFYEPHGDVMANLFKLQIGAARHWNVYAHSFLYFGVNGAYERLNARLVANRTEGDFFVYNPCLPGASQYVSTSRLHFINNTMMPLSDPQTPFVLQAPLASSILRNDHVRGDAEACRQVVHQLLRQEANVWCNFAHDWDCSFAGIYQPKLPDLEFIVTSNFYSIFEFLGLGTTTLTELRVQATRICDMTYPELQTYNNKRVKPLAQADLVQCCFQATLAAAMLIEGVKFPLNKTVTAIDVINGQKLGWALGSMLYEINTLPWKFGGRLEERLKMKHPNKDEEWDCIPYEQDEDGTHSAHNHKEYTQAAFMSTPSLTSWMDAKIEVPLLPLVAMIVGSLLMVVAMRSKFRSNPSRLRYEERRELTISSSYGSIGGR